MCVIIFSPCEGNRPSNKTLELCNKANPHGIGIVTQGNKDMYSVSKGLSLELVKKIIEKTSGAIAIHFRYAPQREVIQKICVTHFLVRQKQRLGWTMKQAMF